MTNKRKSWYRWCSGLRKVFINLLQSLGPLNVFTAVPQVATEKHWCTNILPIRLKPTYVMSIIMLDTMESDISATTARLFFVFTLDKLLN